MQSNKKNIHAISNDQKLNDPSILAINILTMTPSKINFITKVNISKIKTGKLHLNSHQEPTLSQSTALPTNPIGIPITFEGQMPIILSNANLAIFALIKGFFDFLRVSDLKRLTTNIYSH